MKKIIVTKNGIQEIDLTPKEISEIEEQQLLYELEQSLQPQQEEIEDAEFELKLIAKLAEWGII